ncbi:MAG: hypothetical protein ACD_9C00070G0004 [uncultured bacterium]|nr:MAG: hypothetical protein ACD_9C00070G0004 [uncultured bacterium]
MKTHYLLHRTFLISMFIVCAVAVIFSVKEKANASDPILSTTTQLTQPTATYSGGVCGSANYTTIAAIPGGDSLCSAGSPSSVVTTNSGWSWKCAGTNGVSVSCSATLATSENTNVQGSCGSANEKTFSTIPSSELCSVGVVLRMTELDNGLGWTWLCGASSGSSTTASCSAKKAVTSVTTIAKGVCGGANAKTVSTIPTGSSLCLSGTAFSISTSSTGWTWKCGVSGGESVQCSANKVQTTAATSTATPVTKSSGQSYSVTATLEKAEIEKDVTEQSALQTETKQEVLPTQMEGNLEQPQKIEKSPIIASPVIIEAKNLVQNNNPKISGSVSESLKIKDVVLKKKDDGKNNLELAGMAEPNSIVTIYIFSEDPIVITVRADENGNWNYELDKELADGQHEAYVAVTEDSGKIISKSEPIAFVKTAQAATVIPISELTNNQSPIEKSSQQYILIAIVIMSVCLAVALVLIGFLSHKRNLDEGIN